jgi:phosphoenolpyruvate carboxykinase (ATP)
MSQHFGQPSNYGLEHHGLSHFQDVYWNLQVSALMEKAIQRQEGVLAEPGTLVVRTDPHTGRSPNDKFVVDHGEETRDIWWGKVNQPLPPHKFERLLIRVRAYLQGKDLFVLDAAAGAHPTYELPIRLVSQNAWQTLFARHMFLRLPADKIPGHVPQFTILHAPEAFADPAEDGTNSGTFITVDFKRSLILIGGTRYGGEIKKSIFTIMNYLLPKRGVLPMHCSATVGKNGDTALFFGLSGTGKTTLSSDPDRGLIGDDEHGWGDDGVFNFEGGCYAKTIRLSQKYEPIIWEATHQYGSILENVIYDETTRTFDFDDGSVTENTRVVYPIYRVPNYVAEGRAGHPTNIFFLTADAFGVLPPIAKLSKEQAMYYFLAGYTSKLAGTERGLGSEPQATFSACFGAPFLPLHPRVYAELLGKKIEQHKVNVWLLNTGWTGGPYGVGNRMHLPYTRAMVAAALSGELDTVAYETEPFFGLSLPTSCPNVSTEILNPRATWADKEAYDAQARGMVDRFEKGFAQFKHEVSKNIAEAGPSLERITG